MSTGIFDDFEPFIGQPIAIKIWWFGRSIKCPMLEIENKELICNPLYLIKRYYKMEYTFIYRSLEEFYVLQRSSTPRNVKRETFFSFFNQYFTDYHLSNSARESCAISRGARSMS